MTITEAQWKSYEEEGFLKLGKLVEEKTLQGLQDRGWAMIGS